ncbi:hypothetical protein F5X99DRAFT_388216 [Biscogniauxia marginata]|nr:hypothetical protein F5X99DRAFT_388216 [Biscogniauxia marginata]
MKRVEMPPRSWQSLHPRPVCILLLLRYANAPIRNLFIAVCYPVREDVCLPWAERPRKRGVREGMAPLSKVRDAT